MIKKYLFQWIWHLWCQVLHQGGLCPIPKLAALWMPMEGWRGQPEEHQLSSSWSWCPGSSCCCKCYYQSLIYNFFLFQCLITILIISGWLWRQGSILQQVQSWQHLGLRQHGFHCCCWNGPWWALNLMHYLMMLSHTYALLKNKHLNSTTMSS